MKKSTMAWILKKAGKLIIPVVILASVLTAISVIAVNFALISRNVIDVATGAKAGNIKEGIFLLVFFIFLQLVFQIAGSAINIMVSGRMEIKLKNSIFANLLHKDISAVQSYHTGELINRLTSDVSVVVSGFASIIPELIALAVRIIFSICILFALDKTFAFIYVVAAPLFVICSRIYSAKIKKIHKKVQETDGKTRSYMTEALQNLLVIKAFKKENSFEEASYLLQRENYKYKIRKTTINIFANILVFVAFNFGYYFALGWGAMKISAGILTYGALTAMLQLVGQIQSPVKGIADMLPGLYSMLASSERLIEFENMKDDIYSAENETELKKAYENCEKIVFNNITFAYNENNRILNDFNYEINKGEFVAITGISGIGKSTLLKLLLGVIEPDKGSISLVSENESLDINKKTRGLFAYVPQGNMVISGSIRDNIRFYKKNATDEEIENAAKLAQMDKFVKSLPNGLDTIIGEKGLGLSEGQVQRIAIARALLYDSPILLLDEATSALDEETEAEFLKTVKSLKTKTCIIVSHKQAAKDMCDKLIEVKGN